MKRYTVTIHWGPDDRDGTTRYHVEGESAEAVAEQIKTEFSNPNLQVMIKEEV